MTVDTAARSVKDEVGKAIVGQKDAVEHALVAILANGHILIEGVPGIAKTLLVRSLAKALDLLFTRIQFTPDLMPSDVIGTNVFDQKTTEFSLRRGPIFTNVLLADEINRTPPKTQAALLEAMEERQTTIDGVRYPLPDPFLVFATQNPIEFEGTYPLPEAQQDRFLMKIVLDYPQRADEIEVLRRHHLGFRITKLDEAGLMPVLNQKSLEALRNEVSAVTVEDKMFDYVYDIVSATRKSNDLLVGASPRAAISLISCGKALAALRGRNFLIPDDLKSMALPILRHRVLLRPEAEIEGMSVDGILKSLIESQVVPR